jgi:HAD superfamily hydrolase (TIGR01509 family)
MKPQAAIFDLGKVLVDFDYSIAARRVAARSRMAPIEIMLFMQSSPLLYELECGHMSRTQFFNEIRAVTGFSGTLEVFSEFFADIFTAMPGMIQLQADIRQAGIPCFLFSNTNDLAIEHIRRRFSFYENFDGYILSYEHKSMKPEPQIYDVVERIAGHRQAELVYIDDRPENIAAGAARGWQVILQESPEKTRIAIENLGLIPS